MINKALQEKMLRRHGIQAQSMVAMEECAEFIQAISKGIRYPDDASYRKNIAEEMADVLICIEQIKDIYSITDEEIDSWQDIKQTRQLRSLGIEDGYVKDGYLETY